MLIKQAFNDVVAEKEPPVWMLPHCRSCGIVVERFTIPREAKTYHIPLEWSCCGRTGGVWVPRDEALFKARFGGLLWVNGPERIVTSGR